MSTDLQKELGRVIQRLRREQGYSQESFADAVGVHRTYMGSVERGEYNLSLSSMARIAQTLGVRIGDLLLAAESGLTLPPKRSRVHKQPSARKQPRVTEGSSRPSKRTE